MKERCSNTLTLLILRFVRHETVITRTSMKWQTVELKIIPLHTEIHSVVNNATEVSDYAIIK
jgi:hypothetical protein